MVSVPHPKLTLEAMHQKIPALTPALAEFFKENCMVCFDNQGHSTEVLITVEYNDRMTVFEINWTGTVTQQMLNAYADLRRATDNAACACALMFVREMTEFTAIQQSSVGTTIDYYLIPNPQEDTLIFNHAARLEVSGILTENEKNTIEKRIRAKQRRLQPEGSLKDFIVVVGFNTPRAKMVRS